MADQTLQLALRGKEGVFLFNRQSSGKQEVKLKIEKSTVNSRSLVYSSDGSLFAWATNEGITVVNADSGEIVSEINVPKASFFVFSPKNTYLATWQNPTYNGTEPLDNLLVWEVKSGNQVASFFYKSPTGWEPQWSNDESIFARGVTGEVHFYNGAEIHTGIQSRLKLPGVTTFELSAGKAPYKVAVFVPEVKGAPAYVRIFAFGSWETPISNKSFYKAEKIQMIWNGNGTKLLVLTSTEVDTTGKSYFGETGLYFLDSAGRFDSRVALDNEGPIHDICWSPNAKEFVVIYGFMPAKCVLFDQKANPIFDFGSHPVNTVKFSPHGQIICLAGFGNLSGEMQLWNREQLKLITTVSARDATYLEWAPDGRHLVTATLFPRLRVDNGYKVWRFDGVVVEEATVLELYQIAWRPRNIPLRPLPDISKLPSIASSKEANQTTPAAQPVKKLSAYVPPHLRGQASTSNAPRALHQLLNETTSSSPSIPGMAPESTGKGKEKEGKEGKGKGKEKEKPKENQPSQPKAAKKPVDKEEIEKKIKVAQKKIREIEQLKEQLKAGEKLEVNQVNKIKKEQQFTKELDQLNQQLAKLAPST